MKNVIINNVVYQNVPSIKVPLASNPTQNAEFFDTSDATLNSGDQMLDGVVSYSNGVRYTGTIQTKTSSDMTVSGNTVTAPAGYYATAQSKSVALGSATVSGTVSANPTISVDGTGKITASVFAGTTITPTVTAGYITSGTAGTVNAIGSTEEQLLTIGATTYTPTTSNQTIASGNYLTGAQTILGDSNLQSQYIASGISIFGIQGSLTTPIVSQDSTTKVLSIS